MLKIKSISNVITNSSSEVFCYIKADSEILKDIYNILGEDFFKDTDGEGGIHFCEYWISISISHGCWLCGLDKIFEVGIDKLLEPWQGKYTIEYEN